MIYVDDIVRYAYTTLPWKDWCHMFTDGDREELHQMAQRLGLKRSYFQEHATLPHYDLVPSKRTLALQYGAEAVSGERLKVLLVAQIAHRRAEKRA